MSKSMSDLSKDLCASIELLSRITVSQAQASFHPNVIYQNLNQYFQAASKIKYIMHRC